MYFFPLTSTEVDHFSAKHVGRFMVMYNLQFYIIYVHVLVSINDHGNELSDSINCREFLD